MHWFFVALAVWLVEGSLVAGAAAQAVPETVSCDSPLTDDRFRYPHRRAIPRAWRDLAAVPASAVDWDAKEWSIFGALSATTVSMMWPAERSLDVRFQNLLREHRNETADLFFPKMKTVPIGFALAGYGAILASTAWLLDSDPMFEFTTLSFEALLVAQFFHITSKLLIGRAGPYQDGGGGRVYGPTRFFFPGGTPSGHAATIYAVLTVAAEYWDRLPLHVLTHTLGLYVGVSLVYRRQHFVSDVIWGAPMGYFIGRWIVRHRSSRYRCRPKASETAWDRTLIMPVATPHGAALMASYRY